MRNVQVLKNGTKVYPSLKVTVEFNGTTGVRTVELKESNGLFTGSVKGKTVLTFQWNAKRYPVPVVKSNGKLVAEDKREAAQQMVMAALKAYKAAYAQMDGSEAAATTTATEQQKSVATAPLTNDALESYYNN